MDTDYIATMGCLLVAEGTAIRARFQGREVLFPGIAAEGLRAVLNEGVKNALAHYSRNVASRGVAMEAARIQEAALTVVLDTLYVYNLWRRDYPQYRDQPLVIGPVELAHVRAHDECLRYCERQFGNEFRTYAAALLGMSDEEFAQFEDGRRWTWER